MSRIQFWAYKSIEDKRAEPIFAWLAEYHRKMEKYKIEIDWTYPELKRGRYDFQELIKWKREFPKIKVGKVLKELRP